MSVPARLSLAPAGDLAALEAIWRELEGRAAPSFFQSWTWVGCLAAERYPDPWLLRAERGGTLVGLALLNRRDGRLWLHESGVAWPDAVYIEHNGVLLARDAADLLPACLGRLLASGCLLHLSGIDAAHLAALSERGVVRVLSSSAAPYVALDALPPGPEGYLATLSANTRQQLRRSDRRLGGAAGLRMTGAATLEEALGFLDALAVLHQASWTQRGRPGAFANPWFRRFHAELLARALPRGEADLLRIDGAAGPVGYLYNFRHRGRVLAYQSGFDYAAAGSHGKPGLSCHRAAIERARTEGDTAYDFLAGDSRYKRSLAGRTATPLHWLEAASLWSPAGLRLACREALLRLRGSGRQTPGVPPLCNSGGAHDGP